VLGSIFGIFLILLSPLIGNRDGTDGGSIVGGIVGGALYGFPWAPWMTGLGRPFELRSNPYRRGTSGR
jgi:hypothetical protein